MADSPTSRAERTAVRGAMSRRRRQITIASLLAAIALLAVAFAWLRPIGQPEAIRIATRHFERIPGAVAWRNYRIRSYLSDGGNGRSYWIVNFINPADDEPIAQVSVDRSGRVASTVLAMSRLQAAPVPAEMLSAPIPPPSPKEPTRP